MMSEESTIKIKVTGDVPEGGDEDQVLMRKGGKTVWSDLPGSGAGGGSGEKGGYYKPTVSEDGDLSWTPSDSAMPPVETTNIKGPEGKPGTSGSDANVTSENIAKALGYTPVSAEFVAELIEAKADKAYMVSLFEQLKELILAGDTPGAIAVLDQAILDQAILA